MNVAGWRAWFTKDRTFTSHTHPWGELPRDGLLYLTLYYDEWAGDNETVRYTDNHSGNDWYFHRPGSDFFGSNCDPLSENWLRYPDCVFKRGKWVAKAELDRIRETATNSTCP